MKIIRNRKSLTWVTPSSRPSLALTGGGNGLGEDEIVPLLLRRGQVGFVSKQKEKFVFQYRFQPAFGSYPTLTAKEPLFFEPARFRTVVLRDGHRVGTFGCFTS